MKINHEKCKKSDKMNNEYYDKDYDDNENKKIIHTKKMIIRTRTRTRISTSTIISQMINCQSRN